MLANPACCETATFMADVACYVQVCTAEALGSSNTALPLKASSTLPKLLLLVLHSSLSRTLQQLDGIARPYVMTLIARQLHASASAVLVHQHVSVFGAEVAGICLTMAKWASLFTEQALKRAHGGYGHCVSVESTCLHPTPLPLLWFEGRVRLVDAFSAVRVTRNGHTG